ncbi:MAG: hypothetical protein D6794_07815, partial [Deltaproteobacteria bacterium]
VHGILHGSADRKAWPAIPGLPEGCRWLTGLEHHDRRRIWLDRRQLERRGLAVDLGAYDYRILLDLSPDSEGPPADAAAVIPGGWLEVQEHPS